MSFRVLEWPVMAAALVACGADDAPAPATSGGGGGGGRETSCQSRPNGRTTIDIAIDQYKVFAVLSDGTVWCSSIYPNDACPHRGTARRLEDAPCATRVAANNENVVVLTPAGEAWSRGYLAGSTFDRVSAPGMSWVEASGELVAWGNGSDAWWWGADSKWIEEPPLEASPFPFLPAERVWLAGTHACYLRDGTLSCFGRNEAGQLGSGTVTSGLEDYVTEPQPVLVDEPVSAAKLNGFHSYAIGVSGNVWGWGYTEIDPIEPSGPAPVVWDGISPASGVARSLTAGCVWTSSGEVTCWGANPLYLLVFEDATAYPPPPILHPPLRLHDLEPAKKVDIGGDGPLCALKLDGTVWCRGYGAGVAANADGSAVQVLFKDPT